MLWIVHCLDGADAAHRRAAALPAHSARLRELREAGREPHLLLYGPLLAGDGDDPIGSMFLLDAADRATVERFVDDDPFTAEGVWDRIDVRVFRPSANSPVRLRSPEPEGP